MKGQNCLLVQPTCEEYCLAITRGVCVCVREKGGGKAAWDGCGLLGCELEASKMQGRDAKIQTDDWHDQYSKRSASSGG